jgi:putative salt-induced outer membrane protein YdiY
MCNRVSIMLLLLVVFSSVVHADELFLKNGDRLTGKIERLLEGKLVFKSGLAGEVTVDLANVQTFKSDAPLEIHLKDGTVLNQKVASADPNRFAIEDDQTLEAQEFDLAAITSINPPAKAPPKWTGSISAGFTGTTGNTQTEAGNIGVSLVRRTEKDRISVNADLAKGRQQIPGGARAVTEDWWRAKGKYDYFISKKMYAYVDGRYEMDNIAQLDRRVLVGGGGGYQWIETEKTNLSAEVGLASLYEKFKTVATSNSELSVQAGYNFNRKVTKSVNLLHDLTYYPSTDNFSDFYLTTTAEVRANFTKNMFTNFKVIFNYDATPAPTLQNTDTKYILGVGLNF